jgi:type I restriction enzyme S subunit
MARAMKDSGVAWIGKVPRHWASLRIKDVCRAYIGYTVKNADKYVGLEHITPWLGNYHAVDRTEAAVSTGQSISDGVMCFAKLRPYLAKIFVANEPLFVTTELLTFTPRRAVVDVNFLKYYLLTNGFITEVNDAVSGTKMPRVDWHTLATMAVFLPHISEQRTIADYLDQQTALIDQRLNTLEKKKTVLAELRKATIHEAVTKGLNKNAPMKDSGSLFIGKIPAHWEVRRIKELSTKIGSGKTPLGGSSVYVEEGVMFLRSQNVWDEGLFVDDVVYIAEAVDQEMRGSRVKVGDILINVTGASIGRACLVPDGVIANVNQHVCIVRLRNKRLASFVARAMQSCATQNQIAEVQVGAAREGLNFEQIGNLFVVFPPLAEQLAIANHLDQQTQHIDAQLATLDEQARVLKELRKAIIHEAVTGKMDLSGVVTGKEDR